MSIIKRRHRARLPARVTQIAVVTVPIAPGLKHVDGDQLGGIDVFTGVLNHAEMQQLDLLRSSPESVSPRSPGGFRMIPVPATVPADVVLRTINFQDDYSFCCFL